jgi:light-harvesting complex 1 beta chain
MAETKGSISGLTDDEAQEFHQYYIQGFVGFTAVAWWRTSSCGSGGPGSEFRLIRRTSWLASIQVCATAC